MSILRDLIVTVLGQKYFVIHNNGLYYSFHITRPSSKKQYMLKTKAVLIPQPCINFT